jgi:hypothetical protein
MSRRTKQLVKHYYLLGVVSGFLIYLIIDIIKYLLG